MIKRISSILVVSFIFLSSLSNVKAEETKSGKEITIYKNYYENNQIIYSVENEEFATKSEAVGKITCTTDDCKVLSQKACITDGCKKEYDKYYIFNNGYAVVSENNKYVIYNYKTNTIEYGPYGTVDDNLNIDESKDNPLFYFGWENYKSYANTPLYAIGIYENNTYSVYSLLTKKKIENIKGNIPWMWEGSYVMLNINDFVGKNILIAENNKVFSFISLETGNELFKINDLAEVFSMNGKNYLLARSNNAYKVYDSNGNLMFDGKEILIYYRGLASYGDKFIIVFNPYKQFAIYENNKLVKTSKNYDMVYAVTEYNNDFYALVADNNKLNLIDSNENIIVTFSDSWQISDNSSLENYTTLEINKDKLFFSISNDGKGMWQEYIYDFKTKKIERPTCPNDKNTGIGRCLFYGETEEECIKTWCEGTEKVENPKTGVYMYTSVIAVMLLSIGACIFKVRKNYFSQI